MGFSSTTAFFSALVSLAGAFGSKFSSGSVISGFLAASAVGAATSSSFTLRGRPGLRFGVAAGVAGADSGDDAEVAAAAAVTGSLAGSAALGCLGVEGASSVFDFVRSPFLFAVKTLSALSFLTVTRERFCFSPLRSSFSLSAATFLVAPAIACSSSIL